MMPREVATPQAQASRPGQEVDGHTVDEDDRHQRRGQGSMRRSYFSSSCAAHERV